ncbi:riboflavin biosynthesis protein RibD [Halorhodospira neutriphila]|uniref:Riboflavin biosynthesis protein RibD n=2 Tax=Halorhodospira neutriphila TaxID=168379 RepID=A0ABS1E5C5_9GAMM|nr:bifunctional diaminohydroxyphosphoribosylaminopyrimidine deaminase/5-amino-6-(5-phosphoribosylamino)uracil reductase RibD [Halorhodospira neutriphila]MBK1726014.1 riboflavin biosynthesis protein RibD [Halorhodospira neutriphila]
MARAIRRAAAVFPPPHPNPRVGCVLVRAGEVVGEAAHQRAGGPHAEAAALAQAGEAARGATAYVTLEPCAHHGRTPPCADALAAAGVARVVAACRDPNPQVAGAGLARLERSGVAVEAGLLEPDAAALNRGFLRRIAGGRPWVRIKLAASLDGRTAMASGESQWISSAAAREVNEVLVEAGPTLAGAWLAAGLADELVVYTAPHLMGDAARPLLVLPGIEAMSERRPLRWTDVRRVGEEIRITAGLA